MPTKRIEQLIKNTHSLQKFCYNYNGLFGSCGRDHIQLIVKLLLEHTGRTLKNLMITGNMFDQLCDKKNLKNFKVLEKALLPTLFFVDYRLGHKYIKEYQRSALDDIPRLVDSVPATMVEFTFDGPISRTNVELLLKHITHPRNIARVPSLRVISFNCAKIVTRADRASVKDLKDRLSAAGINLRLEPE